MDFQIGIPRQRRVAKVERYPNTPVFTLLEQPTELKKSHKVTLNQKALELFKFNDGDRYFSIATKDGNCYLTNTSDNDSVERFRLSNNDEASAKPLQEFLRKHYNIDHSNEVDFQLTPTNDAFFQLTPMYSSIPTLAEDEDISVDVSAQEAVLEEEDSIF